jgi:hypothetical protein
MHRMIAMGSLLLAVSFATLAAPVYKWVDADGQTHFGSLPPEGIQAERVNTSIPSPLSAEVAAEEPAQTDDAPTQEAIEAKVKQDVAAEQEALLTYCTELRTNLAQLQNNPRLRTQENGEMRRLTEEERQERIGKTQAALEENCQ